MESTDAAARRPCLEAAIPHASYEERVRVRLNKLKLRAVG